MKFLDLKGLKHLLTKIKASFGIAIVNTSDYITELDNRGYISIPFVANHQIVNMDFSQNINVYNWFQKASRGSILEIFFAGAQGGNIYCYTNNNNYMYKMQLSSHGPLFNKIENLVMAWNIYVRLIKTDDDTLTVAEFVQNK
jgi:hypothetical protein